VQQLSRGEVAQYRRHRSRDLHELPRHRGARTCEAGPRVRELSRRRSNPSVAQPRSQQLLVVPSDRDARTVGTATRVRDVSRTRGEDRAGRTSNVQQLPRHACRNA
jgi:hypothetical protein